MDSEDPSRFRSKDFSKPTSPASPPQSDQSSVLMKFNIKFSAEELLVS